MPGNANPEKDMPEKAVKLKKEPSEKRLKFRGFRKKKWVKRLTRLVVVLVILAVGLGILRNRLLKQIPAMAETAYTVEPAQIRDISNVLTSSGSISPLNQYNITTLVKGEIIAADFEEGDTVEEGQVLYQLTTDEVDSEIEDAQTAVTRAEKNYEKALKNYDKAVDKKQDAEETLTEALADYQEAEADYNEAAAKYGVLTENAAETGIITSVSVKEGDTIQKGSKIAELYNDDSMILTIPFNADEVDKSLIGKTAEVELAGSFETVKGTVTGVGDQVTVNTGNQRVKNVEITVKNPGGITAGASALASIGEISCNSAGSFAPQLETALTAAKGGEIAKVHVSAGSRVEKGDILYTISSDSVENQLSSENNAYENAKKTYENAQSQVESAQDSIESAQDSIDDARNSLEDAKKSLKDAQESLEDCAITSPVTGKVISKNMLVGDVIGTSNFSSTLAVIYDLSAVTFQMSIDELDITSVQVGQEVVITADALENQTFTGIVTNVSLASTSSGGVTQYPVTVRIDEAGGLLPGMNVTGKIVIEGVSGVLTVPVDALQRGDVIYVKDDSVTEASGNVPAGFRAVSVTTGLSDGDYIEIKEGLSEGDQVYVTRTSSGMAGFGMMEEFGGFGGAVSVAPSVGIDSGGMQGGGSWPQGGGSGGMGGKGR